MAKACPSSLRQWQSDCTTTAPQVEQQGTEKRALIILIHVWYESTAVIFQDSEDEATHKKKHPTNRNATWTRLDWTTEPRKYDLAWLLPTKKWIEDSQVDFPVSQLFPPKLGEFLASRDASRLARNVPLPAEGRGKLQSSFIPSVILSLNKVPCKDSYCWDVLDQFYDINHDQ